MRRRRAHASCGDAPQRGQTPKPSQTCGPASIGIKGFPGRTRTAVRYSGRKRPRQTLQKPWPCCPNSTMPVGSTKQEVWPQARMGKKTHWFAMRLACQAGSWPPLATPGPSRSRFTGTGPGPQKIAGAPSRRMNTDGETHGWTPWLRHSPIHHASALSWPTPQVTETNGLLGGGP